MNQNNRQEKLLNELKRLTGIRFSIEDGPEQEDTLIRALQGLCDSYSRNNNCETLLRSLIDGRCSRNEFLASASNLRIDVEKKRILYLIELDTDNASAALKLIRQFLYNRKDAIVIPYSAERIMIVDSAEKACTDDFRQLSDHIISMINTELYAAACISYSLVCNNILALREAWDQAVFAMKVGRLFMPQQTVYFYGSLETGRLMFDISEGTARAFVHEITGQLPTFQTTRVFRDEFFQTAECFLDNDLNIAETARQLHVHRNTLLYRIETIQNETGLDIRRFDDAMKYKLVSLCLLLIDS